MDDVDISTKALHPSPLTPHTSMRLLMIGGFLGAGKTTTIARLARGYLERGRKIGIVTNDQAAELVDTHFLRSQGFPVGEVAGACFCCQFNALTETLEQLDAQSLPDTVLTEPVGSCTDLVATVMEPLRALHGDRFDVGPFTVLLKPEHGLKILGARRRAGFSPKAQYIFLKQLEEADIIAVNKIDRLDEDARDELRQCLQDRYASKPVLFISARTGEGFDELASALESPSPAHASLMDVDYEVYAEGEAELGWLNARGVAQGASFELDELVRQLTRRLAVRLAGRQMEAAHVKILAESGPDVALANLVSSDSDAELSVASGVRVKRADVTINARVAGAPDILKGEVEATCREVAEALAITLPLESVHHFRPAPPVPTHRVGRDV